MSQRRFPWTLAAGLALAIASPGAASTGAANPLVGPARAVSDFLEAVAAAAPPRQRGARPPPVSQDARWARARVHLAPRPLTKPGAEAEAVEPWDELGRDGAFLGYQLTTVRSAPRGAAVVTARERTLRSPEAPAATASCAYLVVPIEGRWLIAARRCGRGFSDEDVLSRDTGTWDSRVKAEPDGRAPASASAGGPALDPSPAAAAQGTGSTDIRSDRAGDALPDPTDALPDDPE